MIEKLHYNEYTNVRLNGQIWEYQLIQVWGPNHDLLDSNNIGMPVRHEDSGLAQTRQWKSILLSCHFHFFQSDNLPSLFVLSSICDWLRSALQMKLRTNNTVCSFLNAIKTLVIVHTSTSIKCPVIFLKWRRRRALLFSYIIVRQPFIGLQFTFLFVRVGCLWFVGIWLWLWGRESLAAAI